MLQQSYRTTGKDFVSDSINAFNPYPFMNLMEKDPDTGAILICALRYCVGRQTYMPGLVIDWAKRHWDELHPNDQNVIRKDVETIFESDRYLGDQCDIDDWTDFRNWLSTKEK